MIHGAIWAQGPGWGEMGEIGSYCPTIRKYLDSHHIVTSEGQAPSEASHVGGLRGPISEPYCI